MKQKNVSSRVRCFRRWTHKRYAVFNSIGKQVSIGVLSLSMSLVLMGTQQAAAQATATNNNSATARESESEAAVPMDDVTIAATQKTLSSAEPARVTTIISRKEIAQLPVQDLARLLEYVAGIDLRQRGANGVQADIGIRGGTFDQSLILLNGINLTDPQTGHHNLNLPIDIESIDRIEILQGPGSRAMGPHAFSGIINIVTASAAKSQAQAKLEAGSYGYRKLGASGTLSARRWTFFANAAQKKSDGYVENTDFGIVDLFAQARYADSAHGQWNVQLGRQQKKYGANSFYSFKYPNQYEATRTNIAALDFAKSIGAFSVSAAAYYRRHYDRFELFRNNPPAWYAGHNYHRTDVAGGQVRAHFFSPLGKTIFGGELRAEHIYSNKLGDPMGAPKPVHGEGDSVFYTKAKLRKIASWYVEQVYYHRRFSVSGGLQGSHSNSFGHYLCANADAAYTLSREWQLSASAGSALRLPTFTDLYYEDPSQVGNPNLKPEQATTYELGARYALRNLKLQSSVFYRAGKNIIDWVRSDEAERWQSRNHIELNTLGATFSGSYAPGNGARHFLSSIRVDYTFLKMLLNGNNMQTNRVLDHLRHKASLTCMHDLPYRFGLSWSLTGEQRNGQYVSRASGLNTDFSPVALADAKLLWSYKYVLLYVEASNLFDHRYSDFANLRQPGRWIRGGVQVKI